jgi:hypothetical protein
VWIEDSDGAQGYFARAGEAPEALDDDADIELIEVRPPR